MSKIVVVEFQRILNGMIVVNSFILYMFVYII